MHLRVGALIVASAGAMMAITGLLLAYSTYNRHNSEHCAGGLGWIGPALALLEWLALTALLTALGLLYALVTALARRRWVWAVALACAGALSGAGVVESRSDGAHIAVGTVFGFGCSWFYPYVAEFGALLLVASCGAAYTLADMLRPSALA